MCMLLYMFSCVYLSLLKQQEELMEHLERHTDTGPYDGFPAT